MSDVDLHCVEQVGVGLDIQVPRVCARFESGSGCKCVHYRGAPPNRALVWLGGVLAGHRGVPADMVTDFRAIAGAFTHGHLWPGARVLLVHPGAE